MKRGRRWPVAAAASAVCLAGVLLGEPWRRAASSAPESAAPAAVVGADRASSAPTVTILPLGRPLMRGDVDAVRAGIAAAFPGARTITLPATPLPRSAYYPPRDRYRADRLLTFLDGYRGGSGGAKVLGLTRADISTTKGQHADWGVFGLGQVGGSSCVVSTFRLGRRVSPERYRQRLAKVAAHEVGHTLGLDHCPTSRCLMEDAGGTVRTVDRETGRLCARCRGRLSVRRRRDG